MENIQEQTNESEQKTSPAVDYIEAIKEIKSNSIPKEEYEKLAQDHKKLLEAYMNGQSQEAPEEEPAPVDLDKLRREIMSGELDNLEYITKVLELRNEIIKQGDPDPFIPTGHKVVLDGTEATKAQRVADCLQECVDMSNGNSAVFTAQLQTFLKDTTPIKRR